MRNAVRSDAAYAVQVAGRERLALDDFVACAGATTATLVSGGQLTALGARTDLVTLTIGGNDTGWSGPEVVTTVPVSAMPANAPVIETSSLPSPHPRRNASIFWLAQS